MVAKIVAVFPTARRGRMGVGGDTRSCVNVYRPSRQFVEGDKVLGRVEPS